MFFGVDFSFEWTAIAIRDAAEDSFSLATKLNEILLNYL